MSVYCVLFAYLGIIGFRLLSGAFRAREIEHAGNTPENLVHSEYMLLKPASLVLLEACSYRDRITKNSERNERTGYAINTAIRWLCVAPLIYLAALTVALLIGF